MRRSKAVRLTPDEAETVRQIADLTGKTASQIRKDIERDDMARMQFEVAVMLATGEWDYLDGPTGQWSRDPAKQAGYLQRYADRLTGPRL